MEDNEASRDQVEQRHTRGMSNKSKISIDSPSKKHNQTTQKEETRGNTSISPLRMPDLPLPTPPPMANIMITSRIGYRRMLGRGSEFRSPILGGRSHSMDFGSRGQDTYSMDATRNVFEREGKNLGSFDLKQQRVDTSYDRRQDLRERGCIPIHDRQRNIEQPGCLRRSQTLDSRRQVLRENRANTVEFMSPILARAYLYHRESGEGIYEDRAKVGGINQRQVTLTDQLGLSPLPRHKNIENLSDRLEDFNDYPIYPHLHPNRLSGTSSKPDKSCQQQMSQEYKSKYFSRDSVLSNELEEVRTLNSELQKKYIGESTEDNISRILSSRSNSETSPEYYSVFFNDHYISDIDENEEIKEFICGYKSPERRLSDQSERSLQKSTSSKNISDNYTQFQTTTLPSSFKTPSTKKCSKKINKNPTQSNTNTSAFAIHHSTKSALKSSNKCLFKSFGKNIENNNSSPSLDCAQMFSASSCDNLTINRSNRNAAISKSSDPISIPGTRIHSSNRLSQETSAFSISSATLPISSAHSHQSTSGSSIKSSDYYSFVPLVTSSVKKVEFSGDSTGKVIKSPQRTVVKLAKIR